MRIVCKYCDYVIDRDKIVKGQIVEEYKNIYGTRCPQCGKLNSSDVENKEFNDNKIAMDILRKKVKDMLRKKI